MWKFRVWFSRIGIFLFPAILTLLILTIRLIAGLHIPSRDSGVFLYEGEALLQGKVPYISFWENKPPLIFLIDALGLFLGNHTLWGVIALETVGICISLALAFLLIQRIFTTRIAALGIMVPENWTGG